MKPLPRACAKPTRQYPQGRSGTTAGHRAHQRAGETSCRPCKRAVSEYLLGYSRERSGEIAAYNRDRRDIRQETIDRLKAVPCADCGGRFPPVCMDFDHVRGVKSFSISRACTRSLATVLAEIQKCDVVCANCHRVRTAERNEALRIHPKRRVVA